MKRKITLTLLPLLTMAVLSPIVSRGQVAGSLDTTFLHTGKVTTDVGSFSDYAYSVSLQSDGKIVLAGYTLVGAYKKIAVTRYNTNGSLDNTFASGGIATTPVGTNNDIGSASAIQPDGKIIVAGASYNGSFNFDFALVRYSTNGILDNNFGTFGFGGTVTTTIGTANESATAVAIQTDGKIVIAGTSFNGTNDVFALVRYKTNGTIDSSFSADGKVTTNVGSADSYINSMTIQSDGKIIVAGYIKDVVGANTNNDFALARYNTDGTIDSTFSTDGIVITDIGGLTDICNSVTIQNDGKIVLAGSSTAKFALARYNTNGLIDSTFSTDGMLTTSIGSSYSFGSAVTTQSDGKIIVSGNTKVGSYADFAIVRYKSDGTLDSTFAATGIVVTSLGTCNDLGNSIAIQSDGKIVVGGSSGQTSTNTDFAVARYNAVDIASGINNLSHEVANFSIYPNPNNGQFIISSNNQLSENATISITDALGREVYKSKKQNAKQEINLSNQANGLYYLMLNTDEKQYRSKIIINK